MAISIADFVHAVDACGILAADSLAGYTRGVDPHADASPLASQLVDEGRITAFQCRYLCSGKATSLLLGPYIVLDMLGKGGTAYVYKAEHRKMRRVVAIKVIAKSWLKRPSAVRRFEREVQAVAKLQHPNIVAAHDAGEVSGMHYLVMQYVEGRTVKQIVTELGPQPASRAVAWILQAAQGLAFAHHKGVVHRDVKPGNLIVDTNGTVKVLDLGLARVDGEDSDQDQLTSTGQIFGTLDFMAPEQALDTRQADARSDIYSLGATLWYLLVAQPMFEGDSVAKKLLAHQQQPVPNLPQEHVVSAPGLEAVFRRMVAKRPSDRFQSMTEVILALESLQRPRASAREAPPGRIDSGRQGNGSSRPPQVTLFGHDKRSG